MPKPFSQVNLTGSMEYKIEKCRKAFEAIHQTVEQETPDCPQAKKALIYLESAAMWTNKAITHGQSTVVGAIEDKPELERKVHAIAKRVEDVAEHTNSVITEFNKTIAGLTANVNAVREGVEPEVTDPPEEIPTTPEPEKPKNGNGKNGGKSKAK